MLHYLDDLCYVKGAGFQAACKAFSGMMHLAPELRDKLPRAARALIAWQRLDNPAEGGPVPEEVLALLAEQLFKEQKFYHGLVVLLAYDAFLRESDWETVSKADAIVEDRGLEPPHVALLLGTGARGLSTKTGSDHGVVLESPLVRYLVAELRPITRDGPPSSRSTRSPSGGSGGRACAPSASRSPGRRTACGTQGPPTGS